MFDTFHDQKWFARIMKINPTEIVLMELRPRGDDGVYRAILSSVWTETFGACHHVVYSFDGETGNYRLLVSKEEILCTLSRE